MRLSLVLAILCGAVAFGAPATAAAAEPCLGGLKSRLIAGRFSGSVDCVHDRLSVAKIGRLRTLGHDFVVYDYRYQLAPVCDECAVHGGQRILIFDRGRYLGQYKPDPLRVTLDDGALLFWPVTAGSPSKEPVVVRVTRRGFPKEILVDGEVLRLFR